MWKREKMKNLQKLTIIICAVAFCVQLAFVSPASAQNTNETERQRLDRVMDPNTNVEEFRQEFAAYLADMQDAVSKLKTNPAIQSKLQQSGINSGEMFANLSRQLDEMRPEDLSKMREIYAKFPGWRDSARTLRNIAAPEMQQKFGLTRKNRKGTTAGTGNAADGFIIEDYCPNESSIPSILDLAALQAILIIADGVMEAFPTDGFTVAARLIPIAARVIAEQILLAGQTQRDLYDDCTGASKEDIEGIVGDAKTETIENSDSNKSDIIDNANQNESKLSTELGDAKTAIINNDNTNKTTIVNNDNANKTAIINNDNANTATLNTAITNAKNEIIANANANKEELRLLILRTQIEADLSTESSGVKVGAYLLPTARGGYLDMVQQLVTQTLANVRAAGGSIGTAQSFLDTANSQKAAGNFKGAYDNYRRAYKTALQ